ALHQAGDPMPTEIHLLTTERGKNRALRDLLDDKDGRFFDFCREFGLSGIDFAEHRVHVVRDAFGRMLPDIRTPQENEAAADFIARQVQEFCADPQAQVHVSIAGGRKSMGFLAGYALSLFGREQDRLTHVLVNEPFENNRDFFYPSAARGPLFAADGSRLDVKQASISLADIPFVRLRNGLPKDLVDAQVSFMQAVKAAQSQFAPELRLSFDIAARRAILGGVEVTLPPVLFSFYLWFAMLAEQGRLPVCPGADLPAESFLAVYALVNSKYSQDYENACQALRHADDFLPYFQEKRSLIKKHLVGVLGPSRAAPYLIVSNRKRLNLKYALGLDPHLIEIPIGCKSLKI
ncbi:MAG: TIGR02584 family CRISPR-associated protein, partial [Duodenibacillus sp.]|nr:TIGR02584 family CRISPR-associated protein [Duodenibacillus sp.]